jgi:photosynthetic reaction center H subunit
MSPVLVGGIDVALLCFLAFFLFFIGLVIYLRREDRREGYPLEHEVTGRLEPIDGFLQTGPQKSFRLPHGHGVVTTPTGAGRDPLDLPARRLENFPGAPYVPTGNPLVDGVGPASWVKRADRPDLDWEGRPRILPLRLLNDFSVDPNDPDPRGFTVFGADEEPAGRVTDLWVDRTDHLIRYLEVLLNSGRTILVPMFQSVILKRSGQVQTDALLAAQFEDAPGLANPDTVTLREEDRIQAYFGGGYLYATPERSEPLL